MAINNLVLGFGDMFGSKLSTDYHMPVLATRGAELGNNVDRARCDPVHAGGNQIRKGRRTDSPLGVEDPIGPYCRRMIITLTIECSELPPHDWGGHAEIWLGIQRGKVVEQAVKLPVDSVMLTAELRVAGEAETGNPNFLGPYAQGTVQDRFVYLCWGRWHGPHWVGFRRAKLPLSGLSWDGLRSDRVHMKVRCTDKKGGPVCATLRDEFVTWVSVV